MRHLTLILMATAATALAGCGTRGASADRAALPEIVITADDYSFEVPARVESGVSTIRLVNQGSEYHHVQIVRLDEGKTLEDFRSAMARGFPLPDWARAVGGPNAVAPGASGTAVHDMTPGRYVLLCLIPSPGDGVPHVMKGMEREMNVVAAAGPSATLPEADIEMTLVDYGFKFSRPMTAGPHVIRVINAGPQIHEAVLVRVNPGKTTRDLVDWELSGGKGEAPGEFLGGIVGLSTGESTLFAADFPPGEYGLICFLPDEGSGKPHTEHGMYHQFTVR